MTTKTMNHGDLADGIERLVREYISTIWSAAEDAVQRAVVAGAGNRSAPTTSAKPRPESTAPSRQGARRPAEEIGALSEQLYEAVCRMPGETMTVLAPKIGSTARELNRPMIALRRAGRIRSVGTKYQTRYFPMAARDEPRSPT
jgi:hypothetical protein